MLSVDDQAMAVELSSIRQREASLARLEVSQQRGALGPEKPPHGPPVDALPVRYACHRPRRELRTRPEVLRTRREEIRREEMKLVTERVIHQFRRIGHRIGHHGVRALGDFGTCGDGLGGVGGLGDLGGPAPEQTERQPHPPAKGW